MTRSRSGLDAGLVAAGTTLAGVLVLLAWIQIGWSRGQADLEGARWLARVQADATLWGAELDRTLRALQETAAGGGAAAGESSTAAAAMWSIVTASPNWGWVEIPSVDSSPASSPVSASEDRPIEALRRLSMWLEGSGIWRQERFLHPVLTAEPSGSAGWALFPVPSLEGGWTAGLIPLPELMAAVAPAAWKGAGVDSSNVRVTVTLGGSTVWPADGESPDDWEGRVRLLAGSGPGVMSREILPGDHIVSLLGDRSANTIAFGPEAELEAAGSETLLVHATPAAGSVDSLVKRRRRRDLGMSMILLLAAGTAGGLLMLTTHRARVHARRQALFAATVSHELRTPLTALRGALENLRDGIGDSEAYGHILDSQLARLEALSEDALLFAQRDDATPPVDPVSLAEIVEEAVSLADTHENIDVDVPGDAIVLAPRAALTRALSNLVTNALLHGRPPIRFAGRREGDNWLLEVSDGGPGLGTVEPSELFEAFRRGSRAVEEATPGSGLGLTVVKRVVESAGGTVSARSGVGGGAVFSLRLPAPTP